MNSSTPTFEGIKQPVSLTEDVVINQFLKPSVLALEEVVVSAELLEKVSENTQMSTLKMSTKNVENIPALLGEKDVFKALQLMPGVQSGSEGTSGLYVRGGGPDQNLMILDDAIVYNASHLFGFFSIFNGDALKSIELHKGGFPARFGGRLSSVIKLDMKDGNKEEVHGKVGVGLISSSLLLEGPINKGKTSYIVSARRTYIDVLAAPFVFASGTDERGGYYFYDLNAKVNHEIDDKNKLYVSGYFGQDRFYARTRGEAFKASLSWGNASSTLRWNHQISKKLFSNTSLILSRYQFRIREEDEDFELRYSSSIRDIGLKYDVDYFPSINHAIKFGAQVTNHKFIPSALVLEEEGASEDIDEADKYNTLESAIYVEDDMRLFSKLSANVGFRLSHFTHSSQTYVNPEPRISLAYMVGRDFSVKASYARMNQYVHLLSNSGIGLPTDLWVSSTDRVRPQSSQQVALGLAKDLSNGLSVTLEGYAKRSTDVIAYRDGALYVAEPNKISRYDDIAQSLPQLPEAVVINDSFPEDRHHGWKYIGFGPDDKLYVPVGAPCNICESDDNYANIQRINADGSGKEVYARGIRNTVGFTWHPETGELWFTDNGRDLWGDDQPPEALNRVSRAEQHFGYPYRYGKELVDEEFAAPDIEFTPAALELPAHTAPLGLRFYTGDMFPEEYQGQLLIAHRGSWNRSKPAGYYITLVRFVDGQPQPHEIFAEGWLQGEEYWGRPVDLLQLPDGSMLLSDDYAGCIYRIFYEG